ncbi:MAG TPA: alpha/beta hydrolase [Thermoleophilaceae bacterium]|nr:alpha/beta hydrolase [Thermoleophilaceae bacterium]
MAVRTCNRGQAPRARAAGGLAPCVVLAHGWSGLREQRLDAYAERFAAAGMAALVFDYRHFGASEGEPRQLLDVQRQLEDWRAAVAFARGLDGVDPDRVALWGSSFSGGHVVTVAADDPRLAAVVAQVPFADGLRNLPRLGVRHALRLTAAGLADQLGAIARRPPRTIASVGRPGERAVMTSPDAAPGFHALTPRGVDWPNEVAARICVKVGSYRPIKRAGDVRCPILFAIAEDDAVTPPDFAEESARRAPRSEVRRYAGAGHFDVYVGELFERVVTDQVAFLTRHLRSAPSDGPAPLFRRRDPAADPATADVDEAVRP